MAAEFKTLSYATVDGKKLLLDLYLPENAGNPALVIWIHGGAWQFGSRANPPTGFVEAGYALASLDFRQAGEAVFPAQVHDLKAAIRFLRAHAGEYGYRKDSIAVAGASSGGHLAALIGTTTGNAQLEGGVGDHPEQDSSVRAIIDIIGPTDLLTILEQSTPHGLSVRVPALKLLLGGDMEDAGIRELARLASPVHQVYNTAPPILIMHGVQDKQVPVNQAIELHQAYENNNRDSQLILVPDAEHMDDVYYQGEYMAIMVGFLNRVLKNK